MKFEYVLLRKAPPVGVLLLLSTFAIFASCVSFASPVHATGPISITSCAQLELIGSGNPSYAATSTYILNGPSNVIDCSAIISGSGFSRIQDFSGTFNGNGNTITGLYEKYPSSNDIGLFKDIVSGGVVENFTIASSTVVGQSDVGVVAGLLNSGTIQNVTVGSGTVTGTSTAQDIGGLVGQLSVGTVASSSSAVTVVGGSNVGGLVGENDDTVSASTATGNVIANGSTAQNIGGFVGIDYTSGTSITNSYATGNVTATGANSSNIGGFAGVEEKGITYSYASGNVTAGLASQSVGGFIGDESSGSVSNSYATGNVTAGQQSSGIGGFVGNQDGSPISHSYSTGSVSGNNDVGGFAGYADVAISTSYSSSPVTIVGDGTGAGPQNIAGFVGLIDGTTVNDSYETGAVTISGTFTSGIYYIGGFGGDESGTITNAYATGNVTVPAGNGVVGGFIGNATGNLTNTYSVGTVIAPSGSEIGGFLGTNGFGTVTNNSWYSNSGGDGSTFAIGFDENFGLPLTSLTTLGYGTDEATSTNFYNVTEPVYDLGSGWDFSSVWIPHFNTYPTLGISSSTFTITASAGTGGSIIPAGATSVTRNGSQSYSITTNSGYTLGSILVDGISQIATSTYAFTNVYTPHTISVTFTQNQGTPPPAPTTSGGGGGSSGGGTVQNRVTNLLTNGNVPAATALMQHYQNLFSAGSTSTPMISTNTTFSASSTPNVLTTIFNRSLTLGSTGADVKALQEYLNRKGFIINKTGVGSPGNETIYFGKATRTALAKFQKTNGISPAAGYFGSLTRAYIKSHP